MTIIDEHIELIRKLYKLGFVSCAIFEQNEIYKEYNLIKSKYLGAKDSKMQAIYELAEKHGHSIQHIYRILKRFKE